MRLQGNLPGEEGSVNDVDVVGAVYLSVGVDDRGTASETAVGAHLCSADPVVGAAGSRGLGKLKGV